MDTDGKLIGIGFSGNSDLCFLVTIVLGLDCCCSFCLFSKAANLLSNSLRLRSSSNLLALSFSNSAFVVEVFVLGEEATTVLLSFLTPQSNPRFFASST